MTAIAGLMIPFHVQAQDSVSVHEKYFRYRERLTYFVVFVNEPGGGLLASIRNRDAWKDPDGIYPSGDETDYHQSITFGQTHTRTGYLLGTLATEYALLMQAGDTVGATATLSQIRIVLDAIDRTDSCESGPPWFRKDTLDGFFVREDAGPVLPESMLSSLNEGLSGEQLFYLRLKQQMFGVPAYIEPNAVEALSMYESPEGYFYSRREASHPDKSSFLMKDESYERYYKNQKFTSQDEVLGTLIGLSLTIRYVDQSDVHQRAIDQMLRMISFMCGDRRTLWWRPLFPDGSRMGNENGADGRAYAFALKTLAYRVAGKDYLKKHFPAIVKAPWCRDAFEGAEYACISSIGYADYRILRFLMAEAKAMSGADRMRYDTPKMLKRITSAYDWDTFYLLLYAALNKADISTMEYDYEKLSDQFNQVPVNGTWQYGDRQVRPNRGWAAEFKWSSTVESQNGVSGENWSLGNFSGIDFMLLHNLACLQIEELNANLMNYLQTRVNAGSK